MRIILVFRLIGGSLSGKFNIDFVILIQFQLFFFLPMLPRSSSTSSCLQTVNENLPSTNALHHYESLQNLQRSKVSHPLTLDNNHLNLPIVSHPKKETNDEKKNEEQMDKLRRTMVQDDIENIQERLNGMMIGVSSNDENCQPLLTQQKSTTEYFTPKISVEETDEDDLDEIESNSHPFFDVLTSTTYEKEVMKYLLSLESRFMTENEQLRTEKRLRESTNNLKAIEGIPTPGCHSTVIITPKVRCKLIDWMISVHDYHRLNAGKRLHLIHIILKHFGSFIFSLAILCRTIHLIDRILLLNDQMTKLDLQLRAVK